MIELRVNDEVGQGLGAFGTGAQAVSLADVGSRPIFVSVSGPDGGLVAYEISPSGTASILDTRSIADAALDTARGAHSLVYINEDPFVILHGHDGAGLIGSFVDGSGFGALQNFAGTSFGDAVAFASDGADLIFATTADGRLISLRLTGTELTRLSTASDNNETYFSAPGAVKHFEVAGQSIVLVAGLNEAGVSAFNVDQTTGSLSQAGSLGVDEGLGMFANPTQIAAAVVGGQTFAVVGSSANTGDGAALSVIRISEDGSLAVADHILDTQDSRFGNLVAVSTVEHGGWTYVAACGGDGGVELFTLSTQGTLVSIGRFVGDADVPLLGITGMSCTVQGGTLHILLSTDETVGIVHITADLSDQGSSRVASGSGVLRGSDGDDFLTGSSQNDTLTGRDGEDILLDGDGIDELSGGADADTFIFTADGVSDTVTDFDRREDMIDLSFIPMLYDASQVSVMSESWGARLLFGDEEILLRSHDGASLRARDLVDSFVWGTDRPLMILQQILDGTGGDDVLTGQLGADVINAGGGADMVSGGSGDDEIFGADGRDSLNGDSGLDTIYGGDGADIIDGGTGGDQLFGSDGNDTLLGGTGADLIDGGEGADQINAGSGNDTVTGGTGTNTVRLGSGNDEFTGNDDGDLVWGGPGADNITGGNGNDSLNGQAGADVLIGASGNDRLLGGKGSDRLVGNAGADRIIGAKGNDTLSGGAGTDTLNGGVGTDRILGGTGRDTIEAGPGADYVRGGTGNDIARGQNGADQLFGDRGADRLFGGGGADRVYGNAGSDVVDAGTGNDRIWLGAGADRYIDTPERRGNDTIFGGAGADRFEFRNNLGNDVIRDFELGEDRLFLDAALWGNARDASELLEDVATRRGNGIELDFGRDGTLFLAGVRSLNQLEDDIFIL